jgi:hypothetical protein
MRGTDPYRYTDPVTKEGCGLGRKPKKKFCRYKKKQGLIDLRSIQHNIKGEA